MAEYLFIGGPHDGDWLGVEGTQGSLHLSPRSQASLTAETLAGRISELHGTYEKLEVPTGPGLKIAFFKHISLTTTQAFEMLLQAYVPVAIPLPTIRDGRSGS